MLNFKKVVIALLPPVVVDILRSLKRSRVRFIGSYDSWHEAMSNCSGYDSDSILERVLTAAVKVSKGDAAFERDSVLFNQIEYSWPVTAGLMLTAANDSGQLNVLDFGGSLGSSYFQNHKFLEKLECTWNIVEQSHYVIAGRQHIQCERLRFHLTIDDCLESSAPNVILLSSVLQYLSDPFLIIDKLAQLGSRTIILDRTPYLNSGDSPTVKVQLVPSSIYLASYPCHFFIESDIVERIMNHGYTLLESFASLDRLDSTATWKGHIFTRVD